MPVILVACFPAAIHPRWVISNTGYANEHIHITHDLGEYQWRNFFERQWLHISNSVPTPCQIPSSASMCAIFCRVNSIKADLVCGQIKKCACIVCICAILIANPLNPKLGAQTPLWQYFCRGE